MSVIVSGIVLPLGASQEEAVKEAMKQLGVGRNSIAETHVHKLSFDFRHSEPKKVFSIELRLNADEAALAERMQTPRVKYRAEAELPVPSGKEKLAGPPVIVGLGPAGLFAAFVLAANGYRPLVFERGKPISERDEDVRRFFTSGMLDAESNIQFGEGGAGAYSDGKLVTRINDSRCELVLRTLIEHGAPQDAMWRAKPHIGTDLLKKVVSSIRQSIEAEGGAVRFGCAVTDFDIRDGVLHGLHTADGYQPCETAVLAIGHSARDSIYRLINRGVYIEPKAFSAGVRIEHLQADIDRALYGRYAGSKELPVGEYALSTHLGDRGCYSFCMCPGGTVIAAASEEGGVVTNGMSRHARDGRNANSAICVSVRPEDFPESGAAGGIEFQRMLERRAFAAGSAYEAPVQLFGDLKNGSVSKRLGRIEPSYPRGFIFADLNELLPQFIADGLKRAVTEFGRRMRGFDSDDAVLTGIETRTSSPVRITRRDSFESVNAAGLIPCGEGAGYAGGIMSAAVDGIKAAEKIMERYAPLD
ncbi:MAG: hypothetical protein IJU78_00835 [Clostridia bacterium]|nr:hypothetical protein [Clostridia bacterium]